MSALQSDPAAKGKTLIDLIVQALDQERAEKNGGVNENNTKPAMDFDADFIDMAIGQINTFLFAGFDITAATIAWLFRVLCQHPDVLVKLREEHDNVFGSSAWDAANVIRGATLSC